jgi:hypothetical protein
MKTRYKYIEMKFDGHKWHVGNHKTNDYLGTIEYVAKWKEWEFVPNENTAYTLICLVDLADFMRQLNAPVESKL